MHQVAPLRTGTFDHAPLTGRERELRELDLLLERAVQYQTPQSVVLVGTQGVGKTRLLSEWATRLADGAIPVRCLSVVSHDGDAPHALVTRLLAQRFGVHGATDVEQTVRAQLEEVLEDRRLAEFLHFLGGPLGVTVRETPFLRAMEDAPVHYEAIGRTMLRRFLELDAHRSPLVVMFDELHLADEGSLGDVRALAETLGGAPVVLVACCRPELFVRHPDFLRLEGDHTRLDLSSLSDEETVQLLRSLLPEVGQLPEELSQAAIELTGGNPAFVEELVRTLLADGILRVEGEQPTVDLERLEEVELPMSVEEAVHARIAVLQAAERDVLEKATTLGGVFWLGALLCFARSEHALSGRGDLWVADVLQQTITEILDGLVERDYLLKLPDSSIPGEVEYAFKHNMERELIGRMVTPEARRHYHLFAAQWLETRLPDRSEAQLEYLADHYEKGGNRRRAAYCYVHAGDKARSRYAGEQAIRFYERGLALLDPDEVLARIEALHNLGDVCTLVGRHPEALEHFQQMWRMSWLLDQKAKGGAAHRRIGRVHRTLGQYAEASQHLQLALRLFRLAGDQRGVAAVLDDLGQLAWVKGEYGAALEQHREALALKRQFGDPRAIAVSLHCIGRVHRDSGAFADAMACLTEALEVRRAVGDRLGVVDSLTNLGTTHRAQSDYTRAVELWREALEQARAIADRAGEADLLLLLGEAMLALGKLDEAQEHLTQASALAGLLGDGRLKADCGRTWAEVRLALGDLVGAEEEASRALALSEEQGLRPQMGAALRTLAEVAAGRGADANARSAAAGLFDRAVVLFTELGHLAELGRTFAGLADFHDRCGNWKEADQYRSRADEIFGRLQGRDGLRS
ncbi:MAG: tetratricopeptide repeat protein [Deltaproteobacteria bacterium]|nr:tetratricopeptide repeat protein [Deltaproteobacteria bacterium]